ncbi:MAG: lecithin retinol acyltransferase family protein [Anaeroplasma sp.]|uniref:lecithin retinol acyltransferase family protein n=1 Tax=Anaeroplasma sp. TaxID=1872523 RepID=UPI002A90C47B|nr:lecithin retinol acyltransferase family protein [Anaeroplasma sp.]MDY5983456.1 lecithin retinol acyltransferase family protein [Anaeroplasma sp.]
MWVLKKPEYGDQIRVNRGAYYHHGIYQDDNCIYQFGVIGNTQELDPSKARVCTTTLEDFSKGSPIEVRVYTDEEKKIKKSPLDTISYARDHLGEGGYDLITNNCEHFSNRCAFGKSESQQVDDVINAIRNIFRR